jgi:hypothetical protein
MRNFYCGILKSGIFIRMKTAGISEIKQELSNMPAKDVAALCLRLAKFKKDNKELLTYLLFESHNMEAYIENVKSNMEESFKAVNKSSMYFAKKSLRSILRQVNKQIKYMASKQGEAILLIHFCHLLKASGIRFQRNTALNNLYLQQLKKIKLAIASLHEDLQYDLMKEVHHLD